MSRAPYRSKEEFLRHLRAMKPRCVSPLTPKQAASLARAREWRDTGVSWRNKRTRRIEASMWTAPADGVAVVRMAP